MTAKRSFKFHRRSLVAKPAGSSIAILFAFQYGLPVVLQAIRNARKQRGNSVLDDEQFKKLVEQYQNLLKILEQKISHLPIGRPPLRLRAYPKT
jgi:hypothetical protein